MQGRERRFIGTKRLFHPLERSNCGALRSEREYHDISKWKERGWACRQSWALEYVEDENNCGKEKISV